MLGWHASPSSASSIPRATALSSPSALLPTTIVFVAKPCTAHGAYKHHQHCSSVSMRPAAEWQRSHRPPAIEGLEHRSSRTLPTEQLRRHKSNGHIAWLHEHRSTAAMQDGSRCIEHWPEGPWRPDDVHVDAESNDNNEMSNAAIRPYHQQTPSQGFCWLRAQRAAETTCDSSTAADCRRPQRPASARYARHRDAVAATIARLCIAPVRECRFTMRRRNRLSDALSMLSAEQEQSAP